MRVRFSAAGRSALIVVLVACQPQTAVAPTDGARATEAAPARATNIRLIPDPPVSGRPLDIAVVGLTPGEVVEVTVSSIEGVAAPRANRVTADSTGVAHVVLTLAGTGTSWTVDARHLPGNFRAGDAVFSLVAPQTAPLPTGPVPSTAGPSLAATRTQTSGLPAGVRIAFQGQPGAPTAHGQWHADHAIAVGPASVVTVGNGTLAIHAKSGELRAFLPVTSFFDPVRLSSEGVGDPWVTFDGSSQRFFYVADGTVGNGHFDSCAIGTCKAHHLLAVSRGADPRGLSTDDWYFYALDRTIIRLATGVQQTTTWGDYDKVIVDADTVLIKWPAYAFGAASGSPDQSQGVRVRLLDKSKLVSGIPVDTWTDLQLRDPQTGALWTGPAEPADGSGGTLPFFILGSRGCGFVIWAISNASSSPTITTREISPRTCPSGGGEAPQPQGAPSFDVMRYGHGLVYQNGALWYAFIVGRPNGSRNLSAVRWTQLDVSAWPGPPRVLQEGQVSDSAAAHLAPAIALDSSGNAVIVFGRSSQTEFASLYYAYRLASDPLDQMRPPVLLQQGGGTWVASSSVTPGRNRYVDFFAATQDPSDGSVWVFGASVTGASERDTWVANIVAGP